MKMILCGSEMLTLKSYRKTKNEQLKMLDSENFGSHDMRNFIVSGGSGWCWCGIWLGINYKLPDLWDFQSRCS